MDVLLKVYGKIFVGVFGVFVCTAAVTGDLTVKVLAIRFGMAMAVAFLIGTVYRERFNATNRRAHVLWLVGGVTVVAFILSRIS